MYETSPYQMIHLLMMASYPMPFMETSILCARMCAHTTPTVELK